MTSCSLSKKGSRSVAALAGVCVLGFGQATIAQPNCMELRGRLTPEAFSEGCTSPVGICATGDFTGLLSRLNFVATAVTQTDLSADTGVIVITGDSVTEMRPFGGQAGGTIMHRDTVTLNSGNTEFSELDVIVGGTGPFEGATGDLRISGTFPPSGPGQATYIANLCLP